MDLLPAVDIQDGRAVRLTQGDFGRRSEYGDPLDLARSYAAAGARWVHVVDLDAARTGEPVNRDLVLAICRKLELDVEVGGGVRRAEDAEELLSAGAARVVLGSVALSDPTLVEELARRHPGRVAIGLDHRGGGELAVGGWLEAVPTGLREVLARYAEVPLGAVVVTAIERDGMLGGPDTDGCATVLAATAHPVVASGGVTSVEDLRALRALDVDGRRVAGAIVGKAIVEGLLSVEEGLAACAVSG